MYTCLPHTQNGRGFPLPFCAIIYWRYKQKLVCPYYCIYGVYACHWPLYFETPSPGANT